MTTNHCDLPPVLCYPSISNTRVAFVHCHSTRLGINQYTNFLPYYEKRLQRQKNVSLDLSSSTENNEQQWDVGDLQSDIMKLRVAVAKANAATDLSQKERYHLLDEFARQKRELIPDLKQYVIKPLILSAILIVIILPSSLRNHYSDFNNVQRGKLHVLSAMTGLVFSTSQLFLSTMNMFYIMFIILPILLYHLIPSQMKSNENSTDNLLSEYEFQLDEPNSSKSTRGSNDCSDYSRCLLENWASSIYPSAIFHLVGTCAPWFSRNPAISLTAALQFYVIALGMSLSRFITRLGAAASLHQFPKLLYDLRRSNQPRPIALIPTMLNKVINIYHLMLPFGLAADITQLIHLCFLSRTSYQRVNNMMSMQLQQSVYLKYVMIPLLLFSILIPAGHILALTRIISIGRFSKVSLAMKQDKALQLLEKEESNGLKLRYKLRWRPPFRLLHSSRKFCRQFILYIFTGWGEKASFVESTVKTTTNKPYLLTLIETELKQNGNRNFRPRSTWIKNASERMAQIHEYNYRKKTFEDPLGIAYQQTFGIGASFDFDHDSRLHDDDSVSIHRLRARAAKSAIKCFNTIPQQVQKLVKDIDDDEKRIEEYNRLVGIKKKEVKDIAREIQLLIPTNAPSPEGKDLDVFSMKMSEANKLDLVSLPWLHNLDGDDNEYDPYLSFEDAFLQQESKDKRDIDRDLFNGCSEVLT